MATKNEWEKKRDEFLATEPGKYTPDAATQQKLEQASDALLNRKPFSYDFASDPVYQSYRDQAVRNGKTAMRDTVANAATLTGGYGNSYATAAGNQAYNQYLGQLNSVIPELYNAAYNRYANELNEQRADYSMLLDKEQTAYNRSQDEYNRWANMLDYYTGLGTDQRNYDYQVGRDQVADRQWQKQFDYQSNRDKVADQQWQKEYDYQVGRDKVADSQWQQQFDWQKKTDQHSMNNDDARLALSRISAYSSSGGGGSSSSSSSGGGYSGAYSDKTALSDVSARIKQMQKDGASSSDIAAYLAGLTGTLSDDDLLRLSKTAGLSVDDFIGTSLYTPSFSSRAEMVAALKKYYGGDYDGKIFDTMVMSEATFNNKSPYNPYKETIDAYGGSYERYLAQAFSDFVKRHPKKTGGGNGSSSSSSSSSSGASSLPGLDGFKGF